MATMRLRYWYSSRDHFSWAVPCRFDGCHSLSAPLSPYLLLAILSLDLPDRKCDVAVFGCLPEIESVAAGAAAPVACEWQRYRIYHCRQWFWPIPLSYLRRTVFCRWPRLCDRHERAAHHPDPIRRTDQVRLVSWKRRIVQQSLGSRAVTDSHPIATHWTTNSRWYHLSIVSISPNAIEVPESLPPATAIAILHDLTHTRAPLAESAHRYYCKKRRHNFNGFSVAIDPRRTKFNSLWNVQFIQRRLQISNGNAFIVRIVPQSQHTLLSRWSFRFVQRWASRSWQFPQTQLHPQILNNGFAFLQRRSMLGLLISIVIVAVRMQTDGVGSSHRWTRWSSCRYRTCSAEWCAFSTSRCVRATGEWYLNACHLSNETVQWIIARTMNEIEIWFGLAFVRRRTTLNFRHGRILCVCVDETSYIYLYLIHY